MAMWPFCCAAGYLYTTVPARLRPGSAAVMLVNTKGMCPLLLAECCWCCQGTHHLDSWDAEQKSSLLLSCAGSLTLQGAASVRLHHGYNVDWYGG